MKRSMVFGAMILTAGALAFAQSAPLKMADNIPDRGSPWGQAIETINTEFKAANTGLTIETESYPDQPFQEKMRIYATAKQLPDVFKWWGLPTLFRPFVDSGYLMELKTSDFAKMNFLPGSLEANMVNGKLYGLPVTTDFWVLYVNNSLLADAGVAIPQTWNDVVASVKKFQAKGIIPVVTDGKDRWPLSIIFETLAVKVSGDPKINQKAIEGKVKFTDPVFIKAAQEMVRLVKAGVFQSDLVTTDYGAARNLFGQERAAMFLMGSWEMGLSTDTAFEEHFRQNVSAVRFPTVVGGKGGKDDLYAWFGGNYVANANTKAKDLSVAYLKYYFSRYPTLIWENQAAFPAQKVNLTGKETPLAKDLMGILSGAKSTSGILAYAALSPAFDNAHEELCKSLMAGIETPESFCQKLVAALAQEKK